jgi:hypothetical protein
MLPADWGDGSAWPSESNGLTDCGVTVTGHLDMWWHTGAIERGYGYLHNVDESTPISLLSYLAVNLFCPIRFLNFLAEYHSRFT